MSVMLKTAFLFKRVSGITDGKQRLFNKGNFNFNSLKKIKPTAMKKLLLIFFISIFTLSLAAQNNKKPCSAPQASQFDFWIGNWDLYSADTLTGTNTIYKVMDGCTIQENFESPGSGYNGKSWSVYNTQTKTWQQTWVDNQGGYIVLDGKFENAAMTLTTGSTKLPNGKDQIYRMVYHNIAKDSFDWDWESTTDNGTTWVNGWHIHYKRK